MGHRYTPWLDGSLAVFIALVFIGTLFPFQFAVPDRVLEWLRDPPAVDDADGMRFDGVGMFTNAVSRQNPEIGAAMAKAGRFTIDMEIAPGRLDQSGPARIFSYSIDKLYQCLMIGQEHGTLVVRLPNANSVPGTYSAQELPYPAFFEDTEWVRVAVACDGDSLRVFRNGRPFGPVFPVEFAPESWARQCRLVVGNEATGGRPWVGRIRELQIQTDPADAPVFRFGPPGAPPTPDWAPRLTTASGRRLPAPWVLIPFTEPPEAEWARIDWALNLILLMPFGFLMALRGSRPAPILLWALLLSLLVEIMQVFVPQRHPQTTDVVLNGVGAFLAALVVHRAPPLRRGNTP